MAVINMPASLASAADDIKILMICVIVRTDPLNRGIGSSLERKMYAPAQLRNLVLFKYPASAWVTITMPLEQYVIPSSGYVET